MKKPKSLNRYCPKCKKHTLHELSLSKGGTKRRALSKGSIQRAAKRGLGKGFGNKGKYGSKPAISKWKRAGAKVSKKADLRFRCKTCGKASVQAHGVRTKKMELK